jgi:hypothetical protein
MSTKKKIICIALIVLGTAVAIYSNPQVGMLFGGLGLVGLFPNFGLFAKHRNRVLDRIAERRVK